jgi:hypothetical protein
MTTLEPPLRRTRHADEPDGAPVGVESRSRMSDRVRRQRRRDRRRRRTTGVILVALLAGAAVARANEDPKTVLAAGVRVTGQPIPAPEVALSSIPAAAPVSEPASSAVPTESATVTAHADSEDVPSAGATAAPLLSSVPASGTGSLSAVDIPAGPVKATGRTVRYGIDIEDGLPVSAADFATVVHGVLVDDRGWQTQDNVRFVPVSPAERSAGGAVDILITLASPQLTAKLCAPLDTSVQQVSCWNGSRSVLNLTRWVGGASTYGADLTSYRQYLVSHEVGHGLGHGHVHCSAPGSPAPVMVQQTKDLEGCTAWPWPTTP